MMCVEEFKLKIGQCAFIAMPESADCLSVVLGDDCIKLFALVQRPPTKTLIRTFDVFKTGEDMPYRVTRQFVGTVVTTLHTYHVFERIV